ncbi:hypothetical protein [Luteolibacter sp. Populi]|uniref:hypothetical protein n=1 Tax=Luteolibacter sp. Populi TaxID=3230487 RepID=UPI0034653DE9
MKVATLALIITGVAIADGFAQTPDPNAPNPGSGHGIQYLPKELKAPVAPAITAEELKRRQAVEKFNGFAAADPVAKGWDLETNSEFVVFDGNVTILPKGAIIHVPDRYKANVVTKMQGNLMLWPEFVARYPGLVARMDVTMEEVTGTTPFKPERLLAERRRNLIIVGVLNGNPITVSRQTITPQTPPVVTR